MLGRVKSWLGWNGEQDEQLAREYAATLEKVPVPMFWLLGKTGSGKSSITRYLTGATTAEIGNGYRPQTRTCSQYDFPSSEEPIVRFLDTRGLGEAGYDPDEDLKTFDAQAHVLVVVVRVMDHALEELIGHLRTIRAARPTLPVVLVLTCLHEAYPQEQHPAPDPFPASGSPSVDFHALGLKSDLVRSLVEQQRQFQGMVDRIVPVDITKPEEGFHAPNFGGDRLESALIDLLPEACRQVILHLDEWRTALQDLSEKKALPTILTYSSLAAAAGAVPLPWIDIPAVMSLQSRLIYVLADQYDQQINAAMLSKMAGAVAGQMALRFAVRSPLKLIPFLGQTANAAMAFAYTYSLGKACCWYFGECRRGSTPSVEELQTVWGEQLRSSTDRWRRHRRESP
jgi:uncharacterized protein (DUF697 family)